MLTCCALMGLSGDCKRDVHTMAQSFPKPLPSILLLLMTLAFLRMELDEDEIFLFILLLHLQLTDADSFTKTSINAFIFFAKFHILAHP